MFIPAARSVACDRFVARQAAPLAPFLWFNAAGVLLLHGRGLLFPETAETFYLLVPMKSVGFLLRGFAPDDYFRPLWHTLYQAFYQAVGFNVALMHLILLVLIAAAGAILSRSLVRSGLDRTPVLIGNALWLLSAPAAYATSWFGMLGDSLNALLGAVSMAYFMDFLRDQRTRNAAIAMSFWGASILIKEQTFALPLLFALVGILCGRLPVATAMLSLGGLGAYAAAKTLYHHLQSGGATAAWDTAIQNQSAENALTPFKWASAKLIHVAEGIAHSLVQAPLADSKLAMILALLSLAAVAVAVVHRLRASTTEDRTRLLSICLLMLICMPHAPFNSSPKTLLLSTFYGSVLLALVFRLDLLLTVFSDRSPSPLTLGLPLVAALPLTFNAAMGYQVSTYFTLGSAEHRANARMMLAKRADPAPENDKYRQALDPGKIELIARYAAYGDSDGDFAGFGETTLWCKSKRILFHGAPRP